MTKITAIVALTFGVGCSDGGESAAAVRGTNGGACYGNDTCNAGLACVAKQCVAAAAVTDASTDVPIADAQVVPPPDAAALSFDKDIVPILYSSCGAKDNACHSRVAFHPKPESGCRGWLSLEDAPLGSKDPMTGAATGCADKSLYDRLTKLDAWECGDPYFAMFPRTKYVQPGAPVQSHLLNKMNGGPQCGVTNTMPKGGTASASDIDKLTRWINAGAPR
jgi:hypothetical protein